MEPPCTCSGRLPGFRRIDVLCRRRAYPLTMRQHLVRWRCQGWIPSRKPGWVAGASARMVDLNGRRMARRLTYHWAPAQAAWQLWPGERALSAAAIRFTVKPFLDQCIAIRRTMHEYRQRYNCSSHMETERWIKRRCRLYLQPARIPAWNLVDSEWLQPGATVQHAFGMVPRWRPCRWVRNQGKRRFLGRITALAHGCRFRISMVCRSVYVEVAGWIRNCGILGIDGCSGGADNAGSCNLPAHPCNYDGPFQLVDSTAQKRWKRGP